MDQLSMFGLNTGTMRVETTNSKDYLPHWDTVNAVKELIQNTVYAKTVLGARIKLEYEHETGLARISDNAHGFTMDKLMIGKSEQRDSDISPGFFGEGMKLSLLVAARQNKVCRFDTVGFSVEGAIEEGVLGPDVFVMYITPNNQKRGTEFTVQCTEAEFNEACKSFAVLNGVPQANVVTETLLTDKTNKVYVAGVLVSEPNSLWGYNLMDKSLINRDRTTVDHDLLVSKVKGVLTNITKSLLAEQLLRAVTEDQGKELLEVTACMDVDVLRYAERRKKMWKAAARKVLGSKVCITTGDDNDTTARYKGFTILTGLDFKWRWFFDCVLNIPYSRDIARVAKKSKRKIVKLTAVEKKLLGRLKRDVKAFYSDCGKVKVANDLMSDHNIPIWGHYDPNADVIWIDHRAFEEEEGLFKTLLHETNHRKSGATDNSVKFTDEWEEICWKIYNSNRRRRVAKPANLPLELAA